MKDGFLKVAVGTPRVTVADCESNADAIIRLIGVANGDGARLLLPGRNAALAPEFAWDVAIWAEGWTPGIYTPGEDGPVETSAEPGIIANPGQRRVTISVPRTVLEGNPEEWAFAVVVLGQEGFPSAGVWRVRDVQPAAEQWRFGGGTGSNENIISPKAATNHNDQFDHGLILKSEKTRTTPETRTCPSLSSATSALFSLPTYSS